MSTDVFEVSDLTLLWDVDRELLKRLRIPIMVAGFKITGNAATYYLKESIEDAERAFRLYSHFFPPVTTVDGDKFSIIHEELWFSRTKHLYIYRGEGTERLQGYRGVLSPDASAFLYKYAMNLVRICKDLGIREIYTLGSVTPVRYEGAVHVAFYSDSHKKIPEGARRIERRGVDAFFIEGEDALLPGFASASGIECYTLMAEERHFLDLRASITALEAFREMSGIDIDMEKVRKIAKSDIEQFEKRIKEYQRRLIDSSSATTGTGERHRIGSSIYL